LYNRLRINAFREPDLNQNDSGPQARAAGGKASLEPESDRFTECVGVNGSASTTARLSPFISSRQRASRISSFFSSFMVQVQALRVKLAPYWVKFVRTAKYKAKPHAIAINANQRRSQQHGESLLRPL
jgi:hypothetical protein